MGRNDFAKCARGVSGGLCRRAPDERPMWMADRRLPPTPIAIFCDLGLTMDAVDAYFRRFPGLHRD